MKPASRCPPANQLTKLRLRHRKELKTAPKLAKPEGSVRAFKFPPATTMYPIELWPMRTCLTRIGETRISSSYQKDVFWARQVRLTSIETANRSGSWRGAAAKTFALVRTDMYLQS